MVAINDLGQWTVGQLYPNWEMPLVRDTRTMDLTGIANNQLSLVIYSSAKVQIGTGAGTFAINPAGIKPGVVTYTQVAADMATTGTFYYRVKINFGVMSPDFSDYIKIVINP